MDARTQNILLGKWMSENPNLTVGEAGKMLQEAERRAKNVRVFCSGSCSNISRYSYRALA